MKQANKAYMWDMCEMRSTIEKMLGIWMWHVALGVRDCNGCILAECRQNVDAQRKF